MANAIRSWLKLQWFVVLIVCWISSAPSVVQAQTLLDRPSAYAGAFLGGADPTNIEGRLGFGVQTGLNLPRGILLGAFYLSSRADEVFGSTEVTHWGLEGSWRLPVLEPLESGQGYAYEMTGLRVGARTGIAALRANGTAEESFSVGPHLAYDFLVYPGVTIGADSTLLFSFGDTGTSTLYVLANIKAWF